MEIYNFQFEKFEPIFLEINFKPINGVTMRALNFKLDTGADFSTISKVELIDLGYNMPWIKDNLKVDGEASTADGRKVEIGIVQVPLINILGYEAKNWPFRILPNDGEDFRNLLGRDLLVGFNFAIDNDEEMFKIWRTKTFKYATPPLQGQEINEIKRKI